MFIVHKCSFQNAELHTSGSEHHTSGSEHHACRVSTTQHNRELKHMGGGKILTSLCRDLMEPICWDVVKAVCKSGLICPYALYNNIIIIIK